MPRAYRYVFPPRGIADHARLVHERAGAAARVGRFYTRRNPEASAICVVADDRPGLLAAISAALLSEELEVVHAEAYTRRVPGGASEAVDVFWVRDAGAKGAEGISDERLTQLEKTLIDVITGRRDRGQIRRPQRRADPSSETSVRFIEGEDGQLSTLEVETMDRLGLLFVLAQALFEQKVQITRSEVRTEGNRVHDRFVLLELDGSPVGAERRLDIQVAVLAALDPAGPG